MSSLHEFQKLNIFLILNRLAAKLLGNIIYFVFRFISHTFFINAYLKLVGPLPIID